MGWAGWFIFLEGGVYLAFFLTNSCLVPQGVLGLAVCNRVSGGKRSPEYISVAFDAIVCSAGQGVHLFLRCENQRPGWESKAPLSFLAVHHIRQGLDGHKARFFFLGAVPPKTLQLFKKENLPGPAETQSQPWSAVTLTSPLEN